MTYSRPVLVEDFAQPAEGQLPSRAATWRPSGAGRCSRSGARNSGVPAFVVMVPADACS